MCTVSFVRVQDTIIITSNRDEHTGRENAAAPAIEILQDKTVIFPKDKRAGGSWFAATGTGTVAVLLNGAFSKHVPNPPYRKSRGLILLEIAAASDPVAQFDELNLDHIEPFTVVVYQPALLHELRWDGSRKYKKPLDAGGNYIWSSATLYSEAVIGHRETLFRHFLEKTASVDAEHVRQFHTDDQGDTENGFIISRKNGMKTFSITQAVVEPGSIDFVHHDLLLQQQYHHHVNSTQTASSSL